MFFRTLSCSPGIGVEPQQAKKPPVPLMAEIGGFECLWSQTHCLQHFLLDSQLLILMIFELPIKIKEFMHKTLLIIHKTYFSFL